MTIDECMRRNGIVGGVVGGVGGAIIGGILLGPLGIIIGGVLGANAGSLLGVLWCFVRHRPDDQGVSFARPRITSYRLSANTNPARVGQPCWISIHYQVDGNTDRVHCDITWTITAEMAIPVDSQGGPIPNNASSFGRAATSIVMWPAEHDGRRVSATITLVAHRGSERMQITETVPDIMVPVLP